MHATARPPSVADPITTPQRYREARPGIEGFRLVSATLTVTLLEEPRRARYEYECHLETLGEVPARYWCYHLPADIGELGGLRAWDAGGKLPARFLPGEAPGTRIEVRMRQPVRTGERYTFTFGYEADIRTVVATEWRARTVTYADWVIFNIPCSLLLVHVELPPGATHQAAMPHSAEVQPGRVTWRVRSLRPLELVTMTVAYRVDACGAVRRRIARLVRRCRPRAEPSPSQTR
jgi:hypothetical protein